MHKNTRKEEKQTEHSNVLGITTPKVFSQLDSYGLRNYFLFFIAVWNSLIRLYIMISENFRGQFKAFPHQKVSLFHLGIKTECIPCQNLVSSEPTHYFSFEIYTGTKK